MAALHRRGLENAGAVADGLFHLIPQVVPAASAASIGMAAYMVLDALRVVETSSPGEDSLN